MEKNRLKEEQEKRLQEERTKFIEKTKNLLIFEPVEDDKAKRPTATKVCCLKYLIKNSFETVRVIIGLCCLVLFSQIDPSNNIMLFLQFYLCCCNLRCGLPTVAIDSLLRNYYYHNYTELKFAEEKRICARCCKTK